MDRIVCSECGNIEAGKGDVVRGICEKCVKVFSAGAFLHGHLTMNTIEQWLYLGVDFWDMNVWWKVTKWDKQPAFCVGIPQ